MRGRDGVRLVERRLMSEPGVISRGFGQSLLMKLFIRRLSKAPPTLISLSWFYRGLELMLLFGIFFFLGILICFETRGEKEELRSWRIVCEEEGKGGIYRLFMLARRFSLCDFTGVYFW